MSHRMTLLITALLFTCSCAPVYYRTTDMHHLQRHQEIVFQSRKKEIRVISRESHTDNIVWDTTVSYVAGTDPQAGKNTDSVYVLEGGKVIYFYRSYWVSRKLDPEIRTKYTNNDVKF